MVRAVLLVASALVGAAFAAGCLAPDEDPLAQTRLDDPATLDCGRLTIDAPERVRPGERVEVTARLRNVCDAPFQVRGTSGSCSPQGLNVRLHHGDDLWYLTGAGAVPARVCTADLPPVRTVGPGAELSDTFRWNGTFDTSFCPSAGCPEPPQPPTVLVAEAYVVQPDLGFLAQKDIRYEE